MLLEEQAYTTSQFPVGSVLLSGLSSTYAYLSNDCGSSFTPGKVSSVMNPWMEASQNLVPSRYAGPRLTMNFPDLDFSTSTWIDSPRIKEFPSNSEIGFSHDRHELTLIKIDR